MNNQKSKLSVWILIFLGTLLLILVSSAFTSGSEAAVQETVIAEISDTDAADKVKTRLESNHLPYTVVRTPGGTFNLLVDEENEAFALILLSRNTASNDSFPKENGRVLADRLLFDNASVVNMLAKDYVNKTALYNQYNDELYLASTRECERALNYYLNRCLKELGGVTDSRLLMNSGKKEEFGFALEVAMSNMPSEEDTRYIVQLLENQIKGTVVEYESANDQSIFIEGHFEWSAPNLPKELSSIEHERYNLQTSTAPRPGCPQPAQPAV